MKTTTRASLYITFHCQENIFGFEVGVNGILITQISQRLDHLETHSPQVVDRSGNQRRLRAEKKYFDLTMQYGALNNQDWDASTGLLAHPVLSVALTAFIRLLRSLILLRSRALLRSLVYLLPSP